MLIEPILDFLVAIFPIYLCLIYADYVLIQTKINTILENADQVKNYSYSRGEGKELIQPGFILPRPPELYIIQSHTLGTHGSNQVCSYFYLAYTVISKIQVHCQSLNVRIFSIRICIPGLSWNTVQAATRRPTYCHDRVGVAPKRGANVPQCSQPSLGQFHHWL